jgi:heme exporter protein C
MLESRLASASRVLGILAAAAMLISLYTGLVWSPPERTMLGDSIRILYFHAPAAWTAYLSTGLLALASLLYLVRRARIWDIVALAAAEIGLLLTSLTLLSGMMWGKVVWGTYWTWDARLTSTLVLWLIFVGYLMLRSSVDDPERRARLSAILGILGAADIPIIHFAVLWWRTLHPDPVVIRPGGVAMDQPLLLALMVGIGAFTLLFAYLLTSRVHLELVRDEVDVARQQRELALG